MEKTCNACSRDLMCVHTGVNVYLAHTNRVHNADLFMCFSCSAFYVYGMNQAVLAPFRIVEGKRVNVDAVPNVVATGKYRLVEYGHGAFWYIEGGEVIPLPESIRYMVERCGHGFEINQYISRNVSEHIQKGR